MTSVSPPSGAHPVWFAGPPRRNDFVVFRREIEWVETATTAHIALFANHRYLLKINGETIGYGPARGYLSHPEFDAYDLVEHLRPGANRIEVQAHWPGIYTDLGEYALAALLAWGYIGGGDALDLNLATPGDWKCWRQEGYAADAPRFSFTSGPVEWLDLRKEPFGEDDWRRPARVEVSWGPLAPRSIPPLTQRPVEPTAFLGTFERDTVDIAYFSFIAVSEEASPNPVQHLHGHPLHRLAWTAVYSESDQKVPVLASWGEYFLNGRKLAKSRAPDGAFRAERMELRLRSGWNQLHVQRRLVEDTWDCTLQYPQSAGLVFSAHSDTERPHTVILGPTLDSNKFDGLADGLVDFPESDDLQSDCTTILASRRAHDPQIELSWQACRRTNERAALPAAITSSGNSVVMDFGQTRLGRLRVRFSAPAGVRLRFGIAEELRDGRPRYDKMVLMHSADACVSAGGEQTWEGHTPRGFRYLEIAASGFTEGAEIDLREVALIEQVYPLQRRARFESSDPLLNHIWTLSERTAAVCTEDAFIDTPWRERVLHAGDVLATFATVRACSGDTALAKRCVRIFLHSRWNQYGWMQSKVPVPESHEPLFDYPLVVLLVARWLCVSEPETDLDFAREVFERYEPMLRTLDGLSNAADGLIRTPAPPFIDHSGTHKTPCSTAMNALAAMSYEALGDVAGAAGIAVDTAWLTSRSEAIKSAVRAELWDIEAGAFDDGLKPEGGPLGEPSVPANAWALISGIPNDDTMREQVLDFLDRSFHAVSDEPAHHRRLGTPYGAFYVLEALYQNGRTGLAEQWMRAVWAPMVERGDATTWEYSSPTSSLSHGWSSAPAFYLLTATLGADFNFNRPLDREGPLLLRPRSETLDHAKGTVVHPRGLIHIAWQIKGRELEVSVEAPDGLEILVHPQGRLAALKLKMLSTQKKPPNP